MHEGVSLAIDIAKFFSIVYGLIATGVLTYGIVSVIKRETRLYADEESSYGFSKRLTAVDSIVSKSLKPFYYHRTMARDSRGLTGDSAAVVGWVYIILGVLMLAPLVWALLIFDS